MNTKSSIRPAQRAALIETLESRIAPAGIFKWNVNASGDWNVPGNWTLVAGNIGAGYPDDIGDEAQFTNVISTNRTVNIPNGVEITVGSILFDDNNSYTITGTGTGHLVMAGFNGSGIKSTSANGSAPHTIQAPLELHDSLTVNNSTASMLSLQGAITDDAGYRGVTKEGSGPVTLGGSAANTYTGYTQVVMGDLVLDKTAGLSAVGVGGLSAGNVQGGAKARVILGANQQIPNDMTVSLFGDGEFDLANFSEIINSIYLYTGQGAVDVKTGAGTLSASYVGAYPLGSKSTTATISGFLNLLGDGQIDVEHGAAAVDLDISAVIKGTVGLIKSGQGTLQLSATASQIYTGQTAIRSGTLILETVTSDAGISNDILIGADGTLRVGNSFEIPDNSTVLIAGGRLEIGATDDLTHLQMDQGTLVIESGTTFTIRTGGSVTVPTNPLNGGSEIIGPGRFNLMQGAVNFSIGETLDDVDLLIDTEVSGGNASSALGKIGAGKLRLDGVGTFDGGIIASAGVLDINYNQDSSILMAGGTVTHSRTGGGVDTGSIGGNSGRLEPERYGYYINGNVGFSAGLTYGLDYVFGTTGLHVSGTVSLGGATLDFRAPQTLSFDSPITIVENDGVEAITGTFAGLPEGATLRTPTGNFVISYVGGTGNDVTLTPSFVTPTILAGGKAATYIDHDGDLVTVKITKGLLTAANFRLLGTEMGAQLLELKLNDDSYAGTNVTFSAALKQGLGNKLVDVRRLSSTVDLGVVKIPGDLGAMTAGSLAAPGAAFKSLMVNSFGYSNEILSQGSSYISAIKGTFGSLKVKGDIIGANIQINTAGEKAGTVTVGGSLLPGSASGVSSFIISGDVAKVTVGGDVVGGDSGGRLSVTGNVGSLIVGGSVLGGSSFNSGNVRITGNVGVLTIGGDLVSGSGTSSGLVQVTGSVGTAKIAGDILGGTGVGSGLVSVGENVKSLLVGGDLRGGEAINSGAIKVGGLAKAVKISGSLVGGAAGSGLFAKQLGAVTVLGNVEGSDLGRAVIGATGVANPSTLIDALAIASLTVGKNVSNADILAGYNESVLSPVEADVQIGKIAVKGNWAASRALAGVNSVDGVFGNGNDQVLTGGVTEVVSRIASITIGGQVQGTIGSGDGFGFVAEEIGALKVAGKKISLNATAKDVVAFGLFGDAVAREI